nr:serine hydrolase domain-containing protein [Alteromonas sp. 5E99-2]
MRENFQGTALIIRNGELVHHKGYGMAVMEWHLPNTPQTKYYVASLSKTFTATLIMMLVEEGKLSLDEPINKYLPAYPAEYASRITVRHLLRHRTGIPRQFTIPDWTASKSLSSLTKNEFLSMIAALPLKFEVDSARYYSSANYYILGAIIEEITGESFSTLLYKKILKPLNMDNTKLYRSGQIVESLAMPYKKVKGEYSFCPPVDGEFCTGSNINLELFKGSASMYSTAEDLSIWLQALDGDLVLNETSRRFLLDPDTQACWDVVVALFRDNTTRRLILADGLLEGYSSLLIKLPKERVSIVILNNTGMAYSEKAEIGTEIANLLINN